MKSYHLLKGQVEVSNTKIQVTGLNYWNLYKSKAMALVALLFVCDKIDGKLSRGFDSIWDCIITSIIYIPLGLFVGYWIYMEFVKHTWTNQMDVSAINSVIQKVDEDNPLNITLTLNGNFSSLILDFRASENEHEAFLEQLSRLNSRYTLKHERI